MKRTLLVAAALLAALALTACQKDESKSTPKTGATPPASSAPAPSSPAPAPATPSPAPSDASKDAAKK